MVRTKRAVYGYSVDAGLVDEAWAISPDTVEDGLEPTLLERPNGQVVLFSTAHRRATPLVLLRRAAMLASWDNPVGSLILEWSAPGGTADLGDQDAWRQASPHWHKGRQAYLEKKLRRVQKGVSEDPDEDDPEASFRSQFLNVWPTRRLVSTHRDEPLLDAGAWDTLADLNAAPDPGAPLAVGIEDWYGLGAAAAAATLLGDGRVLVWGGLHATRPDAFAWASWVLGDRPGAQLLVGASIDQLTASQWVPGAVVTPQTNVDTARALPLVRSLVGLGKLAHPAEPALTTQVQCRVVPTASGGLALPHRGQRSDLLRATAWCVQAVARPEASVQPFYAF